MRNVTGRKQEPLAAGWRGIIEPDGTLKLHNGARSIDRATIVVRIPPQAAVALGLWLLRTILTRAPASTSTSESLMDEEETDEPDEADERGGGDDGGGRGELPEGGALQPALSADCS